MKTLAQAPLRVKTKVVRILDSELTPKLVEMGFYAGQELEILFKAPFGDPIAVDVSGYVLSMRLSEAKLIEVE
jgi:ferrous iron transport protein A